MVKTIFNRGLFCELLHALVLFFGKTALLDDVVRNII